MNYAWLHVCSIVTVVCSYITECVATQSLLAAQPKYFLLTSAATAVELAKDYDQWGDPDDEDITIEVCRIAILHGLVLIISTFSIMSMRLQGLRELLQRVPPAQKQGQPIGGSDDNDDLGLMTLKQRLQQHTRLLPLETARPPAMQVTTSPHSSHT